MISIVDIYMLYRGQHMVTLHRQMEEEHSALNVFSTEDSLNKLSLILNYILLSGL